MVAALFEVQNYFHLVKFLCFLLISEMFNEPYLLQFPGDLSLILWQQVSYRIVSNKRPGGVAIFQKGDVYKRQVFNTKMQCLSLFTMTRRREI